MRNTKSTIGGYFELEISSRGTLYHDNALALNSGRSAFEHILKSKQFKRIHIPYFTCDVILETIKRLNLDYSFYHIQDDFKPILPNYQSCDALLYTNYFGLNANNIEVLSKTLQNIIIDNAQAFYDKASPQVCTFYSPRKFFGVPDGGFVYGTHEIDGNVYEMDNSIDRMMHLLTRIELGAEAGYPLFKENDARLNNQPVKRMSMLTRSLLNGIDYKQVLYKRLQNFDQMHQRLKESNKLAAWIDGAKITCPMVYPYWVEKGAAVRKRLAQQNIYTATYWPNVLEWVKSNALEFELTKNIVCIPVDHRVALKDINKIAGLIYE